MGVQHVVRTLCGAEVDVVDECFPPDLKGQDDATVAAFGRNGSEQFDMLLRQHIIDAFTVIRDERVPVDQAAYVLWNSIGDPSDDHAAITVANEDNILEITRGQKVDDRLDSLVQSVGFWMFLDRPDDCP